MGTTFSAEVSDTRELASVFLDTFSREYENLYKWFLVLYVRKAMQEELEANSTNTLKWRLYKAPFVPEQMNDRDEVLAAKLSKHLKRWKPRFFVLRGNFFLDYYDSRNDYAAKKKPLGTINLGNVELNFDATEAAKKRLDRLISICSMECTEAMQSEKFPNMTVELFNPRRCSIYLQFPKEDRYKTWCEVLEKAHWLTERLVTKDSVHRRAFIEALRRSRVLCGMSDSVEFSGTETTILQGAITELVDMKVVPKFLSKLSGMSWKEHMSQLHLFHAKSEALLEDFVLGKWHAARGNTCVHRTVLEARVRDNMEMVNSFEEPLREEVHKYVHSETMNFLATRVEGPLKEFASKVAPKLNTVYRRLPRLYEACVLQGKVRYEPTSDHMYLASHYNGIGECYNAEGELWQLREIIASMKTAFNNRVFECFILHNNVLRPFRRIIANSIFTFETLFERDRMHRSWDDVQREVRELVSEDSQTMTGEVLETLLFETAVLFFRDEHVQPLLKGLKTTMIVPLENRVTKEIRPFIPNVQEVVVDVIEGDLREMCRDIAESVFEAL